VHELVEVFDMQIESKDDGFNEVHAYVLQTVCGRSYIHKTAEVPSVQSCVWARGRSAALLPVNQYLSWLTFRHRMSPLMHASVILPFLGPSFIPLTSPHIHYSLLVRSNTLWLFITSSVSKEHDAWPLRFHLVNWVGPRIIEIVCPLDDV